MITIFTDICKRFCFLVSKKSSVSAKRDEKTEKGFGDRGVLAMPLIKPAPEQEEKRGERSERLLLFHLSHHQSSVSKAQLLT